MPSGSADGPREEVFPSRLFDFFEEPRQTCIYRGPNGRFFLTFPSLLHLVLGGGKEKDQSSEDQPDLIPLEERRGAWGVDGNT